MPIPIPRDTEDEASFAKRAHAALVSEFPDTETRNGVVFDIWRHAKGTSELEAKAQSKFKDAEFAHAADVPILTEHEYIDRDGQLQKYDFNALKDIVERCNYRIADTGNFAVVSKGHTPTKYQQEKGMQQPEVLGFAGPFRLGMIGNKDPKWTIFADEHYFKDSAAEMKRLPTRSPEVWLADEMGDRFMDPIAALGSQTPQLDMGIRFARMENGKEVAKYATLPGGSTTFIPQFGDGEAMVADKPKEKDCNSSPKLRYEGDEQMALSDGDVAQIVAAFNETAGMRWVASRMEQEQAAVPDATLDPANAPDQQTPLDEPERNEADEDVDDYEASEGAEAGGTGEKVPVRDIKSKADGPSKYESEEEKPEKGVIPIPDKNKAAYEADEDEDPKKKKEPAMAYAKQARQRDEQDRYAKVERENAELRKRFDKMEGEKRSAERYARLADLKSGYAFELETEVAETADLSDDQFDRHIDRIRTRYAKIASDYPWFPSAGEKEPVTIVSQEKAEAERHEAVRYSAQCSDRGKPISYEDAVQYVRGKHAKKTA